MASGSGWNLWVWLAGGECGWNLWLVGVVLRRYIDFHILLIPPPLVSVLFCSSILTFCSFFNMFFVLVYSYISGGFCTAVRLVGARFARSYRNTYVIYITFPYFG